MINERRRHVPVPVAHHRQPGARRTLGRQRPGRGVAVTVRATAATVPPAPRYDTDDVPDPADRDVSRPNAS